MGGAGSPPSRSPPKVTHTHTPPPPAVTPLIPPSEEGAPSGKEREVLLSFVQILAKD